LIALVAACASIPSPAARRAQADALAQASDWQPTLVHAGAFDLMTWAPAKFKQDSHLTVYVEGDGFAWVSASTPSVDPTPREPMALKLALAHPVGNAVYVARPCQYLVVDDSANETRQAAGRRQGCPQRYWTNARFAPEVITAISSVVDILKRQRGATRMTLIGYSGGGAVAALLAARRNDVDMLVTVAGNLDTAAWVRHHHIDPLAGSLNPADEADNLFALPQRHFVGADDPVIPPALVNQWPPTLLGKNKAALRVIKGFDHVCCWAEQWAALYRSAHLQKITR
jgi:dienelactone hydrolase